MSDFRSDNGPRTRIACHSLGPADTIMIADLARIGGFALMPDWTFAEVGKTGSLASKTAPDILYCDFHSETELTASELIKLARYCDQNGARLVISTDLDRLDHLFDALPLDQYQTVIGKDPAELLLTFSMATAKRTMGTVFDHSKAAETEALDRISSELAEYARRLSRIAKAEADGTIAPDHLADKPVTYRGPPPPASPFISSESSDSEGNLNAGEIREMIRIRRLRSRFFPAELFADPAWDILLDLMAARLEGTKVSVSSLCIAAAVPATTALRWIKSMTEAGYLERRSDPTDARRVYIHLSDDAARRMSDYIRLTPSTAPR